MALSTKSDLWLKATSVIPGGVNSPVRAMKAVGLAEPVFVRRGAGAWLEDVDGNRYVDWVQSWGPLIFGHADPETVDAVREAAGSTPSFGDRRAYQMDASNGREAMREIEQDLAEGADAILVKPALAYLDVIRAARERFDAPIAAYNVSGEYAMVKAAAAQGFLDERQAALESLTAIRRAGADLVISYWTKELAGWL